MSFIRAAGLRKVYAAKSGEVVALDHLDLEVAEGTAVEDVLEALDLPAVSGGG